MQNQQKIIHFPTLKHRLKRLEQESEQAMKEKNYHLALEKITELLEHHYVSEKVNINKIICLIGLQRLMEAEEFSESLLVNRKDSHFYDYLEYYLLILFESGQYSLYMEIVDEEMERGTIPQPYLSKFKELYQLCYEENSNVAQELVRQLEVATISENHQQQWLIFHQWTQLYVSPPELFIQMLQMDMVHPILKTKIISNLQKNNVGSELTIKKGNEIITTNVMELPKLTDHPCYHEIIERTEQLAGDNPTLLNFVRELLDHYSDVRYPFFYPKEDASFVADAFLHVANMHLDDRKRQEKKQQLSVKTAHYCEQIQTCNEIFFKMMLY